MLKRMLFIIFNLILQSGNMHNHADNHASDRGGRRAEKSSYRHVQLWQPE